MEWASQWTLAAPSSPPCPSVAAAFASCSCHHRHRHRHRHQRHHLLIPMRHCSYCLRVSRTWSCPWLAASQSTMAAQWWAHSCLRRINREWVRTRIYYVIPMNICGFSYETKKKTNIGNNKLTYFFEKFSFYAPFNPVCTYNRWPGFQATKANCACVCKVFKNCQATKFNLPPSKWNRMGEIEAPT